MAAGPVVSVVLPVRNEEKSIEKCISAVLKQDYPPELLQVIVADGQSTDGTRDVVTKLQAKHPNLELIDNPGQIVPTGLNAALLKAKGEIIVRVDGHTIVAPDYVRACVKALSNKQAANVGGKMNALGDTNFGRAVAVATSSPFGVGNSRFHYSDQEEYVDSVYMGAWWRRVFDRIGLFDEELVRNQDDEFNYRLRARGEKILLSPDIKSEYTVRSKPRALFRQYFQYGLWKVRVLQKHPRQMSLRQFIPPALVISLLGSALLALITPLGRILLLLSAGTYLLANLSASIYTAAHRGWKYLPLLPAVYAILHLSYGSGFLAGVIKFWNRWGDKKERDLSPGSFPEGKGSNKDSRSI